MSLIDSQNLGKKYTLLLAHGAGDSAHSSFLTNIREAITSDCIDVLRFNFPYMVKIQQENKRRPPDRMPILIEAYTAMINSLEVEQLWIGGKSMGGRVASMLTHLPKVNGVFALGYPFHPPKKPENLRTSHLYSAQKPIHIFQGERDNFGLPEEIKGYNLPDSIKLHWVPDGDHSFKPRKRSGFTLDDNINLVASEIRSLIMTN